MTAQEMHYNFELKLGQQDKIDKSFSSYDVAFFLNAAQNDLVEGFYSSRVNPDSRYFEMDERCRSMLGLLIENTLISSGSFDTIGVGKHENAVFVDLPSDFLYALEEAASVQYFDCDGASTVFAARVLPIRHDEYNMNINNVYKKPYYKLVWRMDFGDTEGKKKHELIYGSGTTITAYRLRYLRKPGDINIINGFDCELNSILHQEIVDRAVASAVRSIIPTEEPNLQT